MKKQKFKKKKTNHISLDEISFNITDTITIENIFRNHEFIIDDTARTRRNRNNNVTITTQLEFI